MEKIIGYNSNDEAVLSFILRIILGILFFFQGYDKIFKIKINGVVESFQYELGSIKVPKFIEGINNFV